MGEAEAGGGLGPEDEEVQGDEHESVEGVAPGLRIPFKVEVGGQKGHTSCQPYQDEVEGVGPVPELLGVGEAVELSHGAPRFPG